VIVATAVDVVNAEELKGILPAADTDLPVYGEYFLPYTGVLESGPVAI
jgi:hypothetical protein